MFGRQNQFTVRVLFKDRFSEGRVVCRGHRAQTFQFLVQGRDRQLVLQLKLLVWLGGLLLLALFNDSDWSENRVLLVHQVSQHVPGWVASHLLSVGLTRVARGLGVRACPAHVFQVRHSLKWRHFVKILRALLNDASPDLVCSVQRRNDHSFKLAP